MILPRLSVALVTRNRSASLDRTLYSLRDQSEQPAEVIVSDDSDRDQHAVRTICTKYECRYVAGPRNGLYANRNYAALMCQGTHIRTVDDDHQFPPGHIAECHKAIRESPMSIWIIGEVSPSGANNVEHIPCPPQLHPRGFAVVPKKSERIWAIADGSTIYPRCVFDSGNRFYDGYKFGSAYLEFGSRLHWLGYQIRHLDSTYIVHYSDLVGRSYNDETMQLESRLFAAICHSTCYQRTAKNLVLTAAEAILISARYRSIGVSAVRSVLPRALKWGRAVRRERMTLAPGIGRCERNYAP